MASIYASSLGRIKATLPSFLRREQFTSLVNARDLAEVTKILEGTWYGPEITQAMTAATGAEALETATNRHLVRLSRFAYEVTPFAGRPVVGAYLKRWDIENIGLILSAKAYGRPLSETDSFLVSDRQTPAGLSAGVMTLDDLRQLLAQPNVEAVANQLVKFGYGTLLLQHLDGFAKSQNLFPLLQALQRTYYQQLLEATRFFQGDEWVVRQFLAGEIDVRDLLTLLKAKEAGLRAEDLPAFFFEGGTLPPKQLSDLVTQRDVASLVQAVGPNFPLEEGMPLYREDRSLVGFQSALERQHAERSLLRMRQYPLSLAGIFAFLLLVEVERSDLRRIIYGKVYGLPPERIGAELVHPKILP
jgi:V/A-type H+-transporting ATPase subunit C